MSKHTPAPWSVQKSEDCMGRKLDDMVRWVITADDHGLWISTGPTWDPEHAEESEANARLIAAAPEMLAALNAAVKAIEHGGLDDVMCCNSWDCGCRASTNGDLLVHDLRAVIAKATAP